METKDAWTRFYTTGNIEDYLSYIDSVKMEAKELEQNRERNCDSGDGLS